MGGDIVTTPPGSDTGEEEEEEEEDSSLDQDSSQLPSPLLRNALSMNVEDAAVDEKKGLVFGEFDRVSHQFSSASLDFEVNKRKMESVYRKILVSNDELQIRSKGLEEAKRKVLSYTPGAWINNIGAMKSRDYDVPKTTSLLLVGPKGSGKSSLVNRISKVFEDDKFASERAQVSYNSSVGDGTFFLQEYMIPRRSTSFCLYDTRSLSDDSLENIKVLQHWMKNGVRHGELLVRNSDSQSLRTTMICKARDNGYLSSEIRKVNFVIFVVNGLSVLKSMESDEDAETRYTQMIASAFNSPYLAFRDDKPLVVFTHGDLLSPVERAHVRVRLGELLGIPPTTQIFDIPESSDPVTELTIVDMLRYSLEHAEKNLPHKRKVDTMSLLPSMVLLVVLGLSIIIWCMNHHAHFQHGPFPSSEAHIQHAPGALPQTHIGHGPSPQEPIQHGHDPSAQAHIQHGTSPPSTQERIQHGPSPQEHVYHGPLPKAELHNIRTKPRHGPSLQAELHENEAEPGFWIDWSKIRHLWLDD